MAKSKRMAALGRKGGLVGGRARARALAPAQRTAIARKAARVRWSRPVFPEDGPADLASVVAHCGSSVARLREPRRLESFVVRAIRASRHDSALARMLPVFLWRMRDRLDLPRLAAEAARQGQGAALGFFLELTAKLGRSRAFDTALARLRAKTRPSYFFYGTEARPFERLAADRQTPAEARRWGLLMNMPLESFAAYFVKASRL